MRLSFLAVCMLGACIARADVYYDFETAATSPVWLGTTQMIQNTSASHQGTNAIAFTGSDPYAYLLTELPQNTTNVEFYFYDDYGPNPPLYRYMFFQLLEATNLPSFAGFSMLDGGWGTTPPMTENHYYAWGQEAYNAANMGPIRTVGWHKFTFAIGPGFVAMSVDDAPVFQTNMIRTAQYLQLSWGIAGPWGQMDDLYIATGTWPPSISGLYSTGVNSDGTLATLGTVDSHYALVSVPSGSAGTAWVVPPFLSAWCSGTTTANWLSPADGSGGIGYSADVGQYDYRLVFSMADALGHPLDPTTATITGSWAADDQVTLLLNGTPVATNNTGFGSLSSFAVSSGFCIGTNTLDFLVINTPPAGANPSGLLVSDLSGSAGFAGPFPATATATLVDGFVVAATVTDSGFGYTNTPLVRFIGGGGSGAQAVAVVSNGVVIAVDVLDAGFGYTNAPLVVIEPPFIPNPVLGIAPMSFLSFSNLTLGGVYQLQQSVAWYWSNQPVSFTATNALYTQMFAGVVGSGDYRLALNPVPAQAFATPQLVNGFVVGATVTAGGSGYFTTPAVNINGDVGSNATAVASINGGAVTGITITSAGIGYTNMVTVQIDPPPAASLSPTVQPVMRLDSASLAPYDNYQIQFKPDIGGAWANWNGGLFSPTDVINSQYIFITNGIGFFRLQYVP